MVLNLFLKICIQIHFVNLLQNEKLQNKSVDLLSNVEFQNKRTENSLIILNKVGFFRLVYTGDCCEQGPPVCVIENDHF